MRTLFLILLTTSIAAGQKPVEGIEESVTLPEARAHMMFLASDELKGRNTGTPEIDIAARYIATRFEQWGVLPAVGDSSYFQSFEMTQFFQPSTLSLELGEQPFKLGEQILFYQGPPSADLNNTPVVFAGFGSVEDLKKANVAGKIVVTLLGTEGENNIAKALLFDPGDKAQRVKDAGAKALIEIIAFQVPFPAIGNFIGKPRMMLSSGHDDMPHFLMSQSELQVIKDLRAGKSVNGSITYDETEQPKIVGRNVAGIIKGSDPELSDQYVVLSAHYDHVGIGQPDAKNDSIYNGARDNAIGTAGILLAAKYLSKNPPKRSVLLLGLTAEEQGLLGSFWYADHPVVPLNKTVFDFNCDGAGYNDTTLVSVIGLGRTNIDTALEKACQSFNLKLGGDVVPEQNLYERSDNYAFAAKGVPAICFSPGVTAFDQDLLKYYHQPADDPSSINYNYLIRYFRVFVYASFLVADFDAPIRWTPGDKFEPESKKLYGTP